MAFRQACCMQAGWTRVLERWCNIPQARSTTLECERSLTSLPLETWRSPLTHGSRDLLCVQRTAPQRQLGMCLMSLLCSIRRPLYHSVPTDVKLLHRQATTSAPRVCCTIPDLATHHGSCLPDTLATVASNAPVDAPRACEHIHLCL